MMDLVSQAYVAMYPNAAKEAAKLLNGGKDAKFVGNVYQHYAVTGQGDSVAHSMALMNDTLESNGFDHVSRNQDTNIYRHKETGKHLSIKTAQEPSGEITHRLSRL